MCCVSCAVPRSGAAGLGLAKLIVFPLRRCGRAILAFIQRDACRRRQCAMYGSRWCLPSSLPCNAAGGGVVCRRRNHCMQMAETLYANGRIIVCRSCGNGQLSLYEMFFFVYLQLITNRRTMRHLAMFVVLSCLSMALQARGKVTGTVRSDDGGCVPYAPVFSMA